MPVIFWFRRDLRLNDNNGLYQALKNEGDVISLFVFDSRILGRLSDPFDPRVTFIHDEVKRLQKELEETGSTLMVRFGDPVEIVPAVTQETGSRAVYINKDYEPHARERDHKVAARLSRQGAQLKAFKDQVIFEESEVVKPSGEPYTVYTPYMRKWKEKAEHEPITHHPSEKLMDRLRPMAPSVMPALEEIGFRKAKTVIPPRLADDNLILNYHQTRDYPAKDGTSRLGIHLRFGTISIRQLVALAASLNVKFLDELIWREFYMMILHHFPHVVGISFHSRYDRIEWVNDEAGFAAWCEGRTGFPIVDAGMRQLNQTGYMHNRVRMITASFLAKHLLTDWRWGEAYFASRLLDYELSSNNGGWQWAAGTGCDAAPYFRVFNPSLQAAKFDPEWHYIRRWLPEWGTEQYPKPIVDHQSARQRALLAYGKALK
jgi:deoxyribodipyrimidine photo-lyase